MIDMPATITTTGRMEGLKTQAMTYLDKAKPLTRPAVAFAARRPRMLAGLGALGVVGLVAWMNREKIARVASPMIESGMEKCAELYDRMPWNAKTADIEPDDEGTILH